MDLITSRIVQYCRNLCFKSKRQLLLIRNPNKRWTCLSKRQGCSPIFTTTALPALRWLPSMVILVPPDSGPVDGRTRVKYGDWGGKTGRGGAHQSTKTILKAVYRHTHTHTYHKGEGLGGHGFVVWMDAVPHTHLHLRLLHPVTSGVVQPTHNPEKKKKKEED